ncbi:MAG: thiamine-phosphate kinase [Rikenellaceae bacterium]
MTEFGFIESIKTLFEGVPLNNFEGIGDDCAVLPIGQNDSLVFTSDMLVEDIHFTRSSISPFDLGHKSLSVNLSDVAAMGAQPTATLLSLSLPKALPEGWAAEFMRGYHSLSRKHGVALVGGDTTASTGQITINVTAIGKAPNTQIKRRSGAKVGDIIVVTGRLGDSAAGLKELLAGDINSPLASIHYCPTPRIEEGVWLGQQPSVHAMMDISDGVASDIRHIISQSGVGARIDVESLPTQHSAQVALCGGEDYELLFTVDPQEAVEVISLFEEKFSTQITPIGEIIDNHNIMEWHANGLKIDSDFMGFRHF